MMYSGWHGDTQIESRASESTWIVRVNYSLSNAVSYAPLLLQKVEKSSHPFAPFCQGELSHILVTTFFKNVGGLSEIRRNSLKIPVKQRFGMDFCTQKQAKARMLAYTPSSCTHVLSGCFLEPKRWKSGSIFHKSGHRNMTENSVKIDRKSSMQGSIKKQSLWGRRGMYDKAFDRE